MTNINKRLKEERKKFAPNQSQFAKAVGVSLTTQSYYESGIRKPDSEYLAKAAAIGIDVLYVLTGIRTGNAGLVPEEAALLDNYRNSSEEGKQAIQATSALLAQQRATQKGKVA